VPALGTTSHGPFYLALAGPGRPRRRAV